MDMDEFKPVDAEVIESSKVTENKGVDPYRDAKGRWVAGTRHPKSGRAKGVPNKITQEMHKMQLTIYETLNERADEVKAMPINQLLAAGVQLTPKDSKLTVDMNMEEKISFIFPQLKALDGHQKQ